MTASTLHVITVAKMPVDVRPSDNGVARGQVYGSRLRALPSHIVFLFPLSGRPRRANNTTLAVLSPSFSVGERNPDGYRLGSSSSERRGEVMDDRDHYIPHDAPKMVHTVNPRDNDPQRYKHAKDSRVMRTQGERERG